jgi:hypothetical protein
MKYCNNKENQKQQLIYIKRKEGSMPKTTKNCILYRAFNPFFQPVASSLFSPLRYF